MRLALAFAIVLATGLCVSAKPTAFKNRGLKALRWSLRIVNHRAHLFVPMEEQSYTRKTPKWVVSDVDFAPED